MSERIGSLIDPKKKEIVLQRIKDGKAPFCAEKPAPENPAAEAQSQQIASTPVPNSNLVVLDQKLNYIEAWTTARARNMKIAPHVLHDNYLVMSDLWKTIQNAYPVWCREWLVYPKKDGVFEPNKDVVDTHELDGEKWRVIFPASYIPQQALGIKGVGLFVDPSDIAIYPNLKQLIIHANITPPTLLTDFLQKQDWGQVGTNTRIPLSVSRDVLDALPDNQKRFLLRIDGDGVRPLARTCIGMGHRNVYADQDVGSVFGVCLIP